MTEIVITVEVLEKLKEAYFKARRNGRGVFTYNGYEFVTDYAKYFLTFWCERFGVSFDPNNGG